MKSDWGSIMEHSAARSRDVKRRDDAQARDLPHARAGKLRGGRSGGIDPLNEPRGNANGACAGEPASSPEEKPALDPVTMKDWQIAEAAEQFMKPVGLLARELGLRENELIPMGRQLAKIDYAKVIDRVRSDGTAKYIDVTAITPTPLGEGKTTTAIGLIEGLGKLGMRVTGAIRQPSGGPTFNIKGSAAGGGLAQCIPLAPFSIRFTGDIDCITNAHNLAMAACEEKNDFRFLYEQTWPLRKQIEAIATEVYGADGVTYSPPAIQNVRALESGSGQLSGFGVCMVKTHLSLSHDPNLKGRPRNWKLPIRDIRVYKGAGLIVPIAGEIKLMPGTASNPAFRRIDVDVETGCTTKKWRVRIRRRSLRGGVRRRSNLTAARG
jgi:formyltetrahydrofolate synthetase